MNPFIILTFLEFLTRINPIESQSSFATVARLRDVKEEAKVCTFLNKNASGSSRLTNNVSDFKMNIIKWKLHFVSRVGNLAFLRPNNPILAFLFLVCP